MKARMHVVLVSFIAFGCAEDDERIRIDAPPTSFCFDERSEGFRDLAVVVADRPFAWRIDGAGILAARLDDDGTVCEGAAIASADQATVDITMTCPSGMHFPRIVLETTKGERFASVSVTGTADGRCPAAR